jgi:NADH-quinone oxidoreductase subunit M
LHVEATTEFSCLLASVILKVGFFGLFKFLFYLFYLFTLWFVGFFDGLCICGLFCLVFVLLFLVDYKKLVAFWSLLHTGLCLILLWHNDLLFICLVCFVNFAHIFSSCFMFLLIGFMYDLYGLRVFIVLYAFFGFTL